MRLARFLARAGVDSRRRCEALIAQGKVKVDGETVTSPAVRVHPGHSVVTVDGRRIMPGTAGTYLAVHKPRGVVSTVSDPEGRPTVMGLLPEVRGLFPVGRLDMQSEGLMFATDDGGWAQRLLHPSGGIGRTYRVLVPGKVAGSHLDALREGIRLADGVTAPASARILGSGAGETWLELAIAEGRNRQVRRMLASLGFEVLRLVRTSIGPVKLGDLEPGKWRRLSEEELREIEGGGHA